jgi:hypothetical protein
VDKGSCRGCIRRLLTLRAGPRKDSVFGQAFVAMVQAVAGLGWLSATLRLTCLSLKNKADVRHPMISLKSFLQLFGDVKRDGRCRSTARARIVQM